MSKGLYQGDAIGITHGIFDSYLVYWTEPDTAILVTVDTDVELAFSSTSEAGFLNEQDVIDQAQEIVTQLDLDGEDW